MASQRFAYTWVFGLSLALVCVLAPAASAQQDLLQSWLFNGRTETAVRQGLNSQAEQRLMQLKEFCDLTEEQTAKLKFAAAGDVNRFFLEVAKVRKSTKNLDQNDQNAVQEAWQVISPLSERLQQGIFNDGSLFAKVMASTLDEQQIATYKRLLKEQVDRKHHALVMSAVSTIEESIPMVDGQREKLVALLDAQEVKDAKRMGLEAYIAYAKLAKVPEEELAKIFDKDQVKALAKLRERYAGIVQVFNQ